MKYLKAFNEQQLSLDLKVPYLKNPNDLILYHGTPTDFDEFSGNFFNWGSGDGGWLGKGLYFTNDYEYAESYGDVIKARIIVKNPYIITSSDYSYKPLKLINELGVDNSHGVTRKLKSMGYDSVMLKRPLENSEPDEEDFIEICVFDVDVIEILEKNYKE